MHFLCMRYLDQLNGYQLITLIVLQGRYKRDEEDPTPFDGLDKDRAVKTNTTVHSMTIMLSFTEVV